MRNGQNKALPTGTATGRGVGIAMFLLVLLSLAAPPASAATNADAPAPGCYNAVYLVRDRTLVRVDQGTAEPVSRFDAPLDAVAYVPATQAFWAISGERVISFDQAGTVRSRAPLPSALRRVDLISSVTGTATAAAAGSEDHWIVRTGGEIVTYRMPALQEVSRRKLAGPGADVLLAPRIADWDLNPVDGRLYTIVAGPPAQVVAIDPRTGNSTVLATPPGLPVLGSFGAVAVDPQGTLHALHDRSGRIYRLTLADLDRAVTSTPAGGPATSSDATSCPAGWDYGDAPTPYPTRRADDGPRHPVSTDLTLGRAITADDDARRTDHDDALAQPPTVTRGGKLRITVTVRNTTRHNAMLAAWHDLDGNGRFDQADLATATVRPGTKSVTLAWPWRTTKKANKTAMLRIRLYGGPLGYDKTAPRPTGPGGSGEVEDHPIQVRAPQAGDKTDVRNLAGPAGGDLPAVPDPGAPPQPVAVAHDRRNHAITGGTPREKDGLPLTWSVFVGLLVPAASVAARAAAKRGSQ
ncbi:DUF6923 family protein [Asanoa siamensis]|uniref:Uncharacterized protein n=1 Tax=Asanoa siamensis TaxID=926357 RepID=A0ABQ4D239_9ACTN|nr:GEVED domain-containing protein [Asanoa siamensis]GIF77598.1 hypothetical protein Asi02nite_71160 [Asanoa siamensis]